MTPAPELPNLTPLRSAALAVAFAALFYLMYPPADLDPLAFLVLTPLLFLVEREERPRRLVLWAWLAGILAFSAGFIWLRHVTWVGIVLLGGITGAYVALFAALLRAVARRPGPAGYAFTMIAWTGTEYLRGVLFGGIPWFLLGHTQYKILPLVQVSDLTGAYGLSALVAGLGYLVYWAASSTLSGRTARGPAFLAAAVIQVVLSLAAYAYGSSVLAPPSPGDGPRIAVIQANIPQDLKTEFTPESLREIYRLHREMSFSLQEDYDLLAWPETMFPYPVGRFPENVEELRAVAGLSGRDFLVGVLTTAPVDPAGSRFRTYNSAYLFDRTGAIQGRYDKMHLVPIGETVPGLRTFPFLGELVLRLSALGGVPDLIPGDRMSIFRTGSHPFGVLICFDVIFPDLYQEWSNRGATFLITLSNDGWFRDGAELEQTLIMSQFGCAGSKLGMARAMNTGISSFIDPYGRAEILVGEGHKTKEVPGTMVRAVHLGRGPTLYVRWGDWFAQGCAGVMLGSWLMAILRRRHRLLERAKIA